MPGHGGLTSFFCFCVIVGVNSNHCCGGQPYSSTTTSKYKRNTVRNTLTRLLCHQRIFTASITTSRPAYNGNQQFTRIFVKSFWCSHIWVCWSMLILWSGDDSSGVQGWHQSIGHKIAKMRRLAASKHREMMDFINYPSSQLFHWNSTSIAVIWNLALFKSNHCGEQSEKARLSLYLIIAGTVIAPSLHLSPLSLSLLSLKTTFHNCIVTDEGAVGRSLVEFLLWRHIAVLSQNKRKLFSGLFARAMKDGSSLPEGETGAL